MSSPSLLDLDLRALPVHMDVSYDPVRAVVWVVDHSVVREPRHGLQGRVILRAYTPTPLRQSTPEGLLEAVRIALAREHVDAPITLREPPGAPWESPPRLLTYREYMAVYELHTGQAAEDQRARQRSHTREGQPGQARAPRKPRDTRSRKTKIREKWMIPNVQQSR